MQLGRPHWPSAELVGVFYRLLKQSRAFSTELNTGPMRLPRSKWTLTPASAPAVGYSGAGFLVAGLCVLCRVLGMAKILKFLCLLVAILLSLLGSSYEFGYSNGVGQLSPPAGLPILIHLLWDPIPYLCFGGIVCGGLLFSYGKNAFLPWSNLICGEVNHADVSLIRTNSILETAQRLVLMSGLTLCFLRLVAALGMFDLGYDAMIYTAGRALFSLVVTGVISLLLIQPVKAYWENQSLQDDD